MEPGTLSPKPIWNPVKEKEEMHLNVQPKMSATLARSRSKERQDAVGGYPCYLLLLLKTYQRKGRCVETEFEF